MRPRRITDQTLAYWSHRISRIADPEHRSLATAIYEALCHQITQTRLTAARLSDAEALLSHPELWDTDRDNR